MNIKKVFTLDVYKRQVVTSILRVSQTEKLWHSARALWQSFSDISVLIQTFLPVISVQVQEKDVYRRQKKNNLEATVLGKLEYFNPAGSVKDRIAKAMVDEAEPVSYTHLSTICQ